MSAIVASAAQLRNGRRVLKAQAANPAQATMMAARDNTTPSFECAPSSAATPTTAVVAAIRANGPALNQRTLALTQPSWRDGDASSSWLRAFSFGGRRVADARTIPNATRERVATIAGAPRSAPIAKQKQSKDAAMNNHPARTLRRSPSRAARSSHAPPAANAEAARTSIIEQSPPSLCLCSRVGDRSEATRARCA